MLARAWERVHSPILGLLESLPGTPAALHVSGVLMDFVEQRYAQDLARLRALVQKGQVEVLGGGWFDPILSLLPERDALAQLLLTQRRMEALLGVSPRGAWLVHGAWDPVLPRILGRAGLEYALVDGGSLVAMGLPAQEVQGYLSTEREGVPLALFPLDMDLAPVDTRLDPARVVPILRRKAMGDQRCVAWIMDTRDFGLRPGTWDRAWGREGGWMPRVMRQIASQDHWIKAVSFRTILDRLPPERRIYLPSTMAPGLQRLALGQDLDTAAVPCTPIQPGPPTQFEAFLARYEEANRLHKRMLRTSRALEQLEKALRKSPPERVDLQRDALEKGLFALYRGQSAAPFGLDPWGGVYQGRLRHESFAAMVRAEGLVNRALGARERVRFEKRDLDCDQHEEVLVHTPHFGAVVDPNTGGALVELDVWALPGNLLNTFARRQEAWHSQLADSLPLPALVEGGEAPGAVHVEIDDGDAPAPTPQGAPPRGGVAAHLLAQDAFPRDAFLDRFLGPETTLENLRRGQFPELGDFVGATFEMLKTEPQEGSVEILLARDGMVQTPTRPHSVRVVKRYRFRGDKAAFDVGYKLTNRYPEPITTAFGVEINLNLDSERGGRQYLWLDRTDLRDLGAAGERPQVTEVVWGDEERGFQLVLAIETPCLLYHYPVEALRRTPDATEPCWQGTCLLLRWDMPLWGNEQRTLDIGVSLRIARPGGAQASVRASEKGRSG